MPCYDPQSESDYARADAKREFQAGLDTLTRLLCEAMHVIDGAEDTSGEAIYGCSAELHAWWKIHRTAEARRGQ